MADKLFVTQIVTDLFYKVSTSLLSHPEVSYISQVLLLWRLKPNAGPYLAVKSTANHVSISTTIMFCRAPITAASVIVSSYLNGITVYLKEKAGIKYSGIAGSLFCFFLSVTCDKHVCKFWKMTEFVHFTGKIQKFLIYLFVAAVLLLQCFLAHGGSKNRHGKRKLLNVSHIFRSSSKLVFALNCWFLKKFH